MQPEFIYSNKIMSGYKIIKWGNTDQSFKVQRLYLEINVKQQQNPNSIITDPSMIMAYAQPLRSMVYIDILTKCKRTKLFKSHLYWGSNIIGVGWLWRERERERLAEEVKVEGLKMVWTNLTKCWPPEDQSDLWEGSPRDLKILAGTRATNKSREHKKQRKA